MTRQYGRVSSYPDPPDFGPVLDYPSAGSEVGPLWRILWHMLCEAGGPVKLSELCAQGCAAYQDRTGRAIPEVTAANLVLGAARAGYLTEDKVGRCPAYRVTGTELVL